MVTANKKEIQDAILRALGLEVDQPPFALTPAQTAKILQVKTTTLDCWASTGRHDLVYIKIGRQRLYPLQDVIKHITNHRRVSTSSQNNEAAA